jgi:hypothetical protein
VKDDEVPERDRSLSVECDGVFVLDNEGGYAGPGWLSEFRNNNTAFKLEIEVRGVEGHRPDPLQL